MRGFGRQPILEEPGKQVQEDERAQRDKYDHVMKQEGDSKISERF